MARKDADTKVDRRKFLTGVAAGAASAMAAPAARAADAPAPNAIGVPFTAEIRVSTVDSLVRQRGNVMLKRQTWNFAMLGALLLCVGLNQAVPSAYAQGAQRGPPPTFSGFLPIVFSKLTGVMRVVRPWGIAGDSVPNCTPPAQWQVAGAVYDSRQCNEGGSFDARPDEFYLELELR